MRRSPHKQPSRFTLSALAAVLCAATGSLVVAGPASAQTPPNLVGTWKGMAQAVGIGSNPYRVPDGPGPVFFDKQVEFTYNITNQEGARFFGNMSSGTGTETIIGGLQAPNYNSGVFLDDDGRYSFTLRDPTTIDLCYDHQYPKSKVVACYTLKKQ